jgi:hypothetical protein
MSASSLHGLDASGFGSWLCEHEDLACGAFLRSGYPTGTTEERFRIGSREKGRIKPEF